jgi:hypothetical protein
VSPLSAGTEAAERQRRFAPWDPLKGVDLLIERAAQQRTIGSNSLRTMWWMYRLPSESGYVDAHSPSD